VAIHIERLQKERPGIQTKKMEVEMKAKSLDPRYLVPRGIPEELTMHMKVVPERLNLPAECIHCRREYIFGDGIIYLTYFNEGEHFGYLWFDSIECLLLHWEFEPPYH
jgi:hypothetical protein